ncbi:MAG: methylated-DNA--[protein]-cysteine S-methyltransferase [Actinomycetota bacterium]|nr:methylated-DNA--[protein]-cysteine S-methyltransferase [Actinomycetota bacterium]
MWRKKAGRTVVIYLGNRSMDFLEFMDNIKNNCEGLKEIRITSKKSAFIEREIRGYLEGKSKEINLKVEFMTGTKFQKKIWQKLNLVSYGQTISYRKLADMAGYRGAWRPAGSALKSNPVLLAVPCHRVVKSDGSPGRFKGGRKLKKLLLELEKSG